MPMKAELQAKVDELNAILNDLKQKHTSDVLPTEARVGVGNKDDNDVATYAAISKRMCNLSTS